MPSNRPTGKRVPRSFFLAALWVGLLFAISTLVGFQSLHTNQRSPDLSTYPWVYLRDDRQLQAGENPSEVIVVGDLNLGRGLAGESGIFNAVAPWLSAADLAFGNLECTLAADPTLSTGSEGDHAQGPYILIAPAAAAQSLQAVGFDLLGLANNHALDRGPEGLRETVQILDTAGIEPVGVGSTTSQVFQPVIREVEGVRLAFLAFNFIPSPASHQTQTPGHGWKTARWDPEPALAAVRAASLGAEAVIVATHWGYEYDSRADPAQKELARALLEAGADLVVGHHPHVVQEISVHYKEEDTPGLVAYSLGNFAFDQGAGETQQGLVLRAFFDQHGLRAVQALPVLAGPHPRLLDPQGSAAFLELLQPKRQPLGFTCTPDTCTPVSPPEAASASIFQSGSVDLTGDGSPEEIHLVGKRLLVFQEGALAWESPPEWQVLDLAIGDANLDGRPELALALMKPDDSGVLRSHPFLFGYRGGQYRTIWGGSAVGAPLREVELGDIDSDGEPELIVLEQQKESPYQALTVWRWHGWGFSLQWRSAPGEYTDLLFIPGEGGLPPKLRVLERK